MAVTQAEVLNLFSQIGAIANSDNFLLYKANANGTMTAAKVTAQVLRAYLAGAYSVTIGEDGYFYIGGVKTNVEASGSGDGAFDISEYNASNGIPVQYASLKEAIGDGGANIPGNKRKGGMTVKYIDSSGKYVQWRYTETLITDAKIAEINNWVSADYIDNIFRLDSTMTAGQTLKKWKGGFPAGCHYRVRLVGASFTGSAIALALKDVTHSNYIAAIDSAYFSDYVIEGFTDTATEELELVLVCNGITAVYGAVYATIDDGSYLNRLSCLQDATESCIDILQELYISDFGVGNYDGYYLYLRRYYDNVFVQVYGRVNNPLSETMVGQAAFSVTDSMKCVNFLAINGSGLKGSVVASPNLIRCIGSNNYSSRANRIVEGAVSNISNCPIIAAYKEQTAMYFEGLDMSQDYYIRMVYYDGHYYLQLSNSDLFSVSNVVAQADVTAPGWQQMKPYNNQGSVTGIVRIETLEPFAAYMIDKEACTSGDFVKIQIQKLWNSTGKEVHVKAGDSLLDGILQATETMNSTVYVDSGTYNLENEFKAHYGNDFFTNFSNSSVRGIILKNRVSVVFAPSAKVVFNYTGNNDIVKNLFSPFNSGDYGFTLENADIEASNCRYCVHDERAGEPDVYTNRYINCRMVLDNSSNNYWNHGSQTAWGYHQCIGGGLGKNGEIEIRGCWFQSEGIDSLNGGTGYSIVSWHNASVAGAKSVIVMTDSRFEGKGGFRLSHYGSSTLKSLAVLTNNVLGRPSENTYENAGAYNVENTEIIEWNNIVGSVAVSALQQVTNQTAVNIQILPNCLNRWLTPVSALTVTFASGYSDTISEYMLEFTVTGNSFALTMPDGVTWMNDEEPDWTQGYTYQISVLNGMAIAAGWPSSLSSSD